MSPGSNPKSDEASVAREAAINTPELFRMLEYLGKAHGHPRYVLEGGVAYHYTDAAGLCGMISNGRLWATDVRFLNDPSEGKLFPGRFVDFMRAKPGGLSPIETRVIDEVSERLKTRLNEDTFSVSFCAEGDLLSQWRGYGSFGLGYAVGFDLRGLIHPQIGRLIQIEYGFEGVRPLAYDLLSIYAEACLKHGHWMGSFFDEFAYLLLYLSLGFKDAGYQEEKEMRILTQAHAKPDKIFKEVAPLKFRPRASDIVPYIDLAPRALREEEDAKRLPICKIVVGWRVDFERNKSSMERLLRANGYTHVEIVRSIIPFQP